MPVAAERVPAWREHIAGGGVRVFDQDGTVVGYAAVQDDELASLYVDPAAQGAGVGGRLLADAHERIRAAGHARAWLYVYADNGHGCAFYERHGWVAVGGLVGEAHWRAPGPPLRARPLSVLVAVTDHAVERFRQRIGGRSGEVDARPEIVARVTRAWEAGRVDDEPPPGATGARGSVYVRDLVDRSLVFVCRHDRGAGEVVVVTLWEAEGGAGSTACRPEMDRHSATPTRAEWYLRCERASQPKEGRQWPSPRISSSSPTARSTRPSCWMPCASAPSEDRST